MLRNPGRALFCVLLVAPMVSQPKSAHAQSLLVPSVTATQQIYPERFSANGTDLGVSTRPINVNPHGVNYNDCISNISLQFTLLLNGFDGSENMQIWATTSSDCTSTTSRGIGGVPTCWQLNGGLTATPIGTPTSKSFNIRVQDLVGPQNAPPNPPVIVNEGPSACSTQTSFAAIPITIWFLPVTAGSGAIPQGATSYSQQITTDMVGPPPPSAVAALAGDTLLSVTWTANADADTAGYDVFVDPPPGTVALASDAATDASNQAATSAGIADASFTTMLVCPGAGSTPGGGAASSPDAGDGSSDAASGDAATSVDAATSGDAASMATASDAGCFTVLTPGSGSPITCQSTALLTAATLPNGGAATIIENDASGTAGNDSGVTTSSGSSANGGISNIPCANALGVGSDCYSSGVATLTGEANGHYTIKGLTNGVTYSVAVAAVDGSGNVGPQSLPLACDYPAPVNDFFTNYRNSGGKAGGGFCALEAVGMPAGSALGFGVLAAGWLGAWRRRRRSA